MADSLFPEVIFHANEDFTIPADEEQRKALIAYYTKLLEPSGGYAARDAALRKVAGIRLAALTTYQLGSESTDW